MEKIKISQGQGYGGQVFRTGEIFRNPREKNQILIVLSASKQYFREDGMSFGVGDESGYIFSADCREATTEESVPLLAHEAAVALRKTQKIRIQEIAAKIRETGTRPEGNENSPEGERLLDSQNVYGGGSWFVVSPTEIWHVQNNGSDGDDWSANNVRTGGAGGIGWKISGNPELEAEIRFLDEVFYGEEKAEAAAEKVEEEKKIAERKKFVRSCAEVLRAAVLRVGGFEKMTEIFMKSKNDRILPREYAKNGKPISDAHRFTLQEIREVLQK